MMGDISFVFIEIFQTYMVLSWYYPWYYPGLVELTFRFQDLAHVDTFKNQYLDGPIGASLSGTKCPSP